MRWPRAGTVGLLLLLLGCAGCVERLVDFHVRRLESLRVTSIDGNGFNLKVRCELENPNPIGARVSEVRFKTYAGPHALGEGTLPRPVEVAPKSRFVLEVPVRVTYARLPADFPSRVKDGTLLLRTETDLRAATKLGSYRMHLVAEDRTRISEALQVAIQGPFSGRALRIESISLAGVQLRRVKLRIRFVARNMFAFPVRIVRAAYSIAINGSHFGDGTLSKPIAIPPGREVAVEVEVAATHGAVGSAIAAMMGAEPRFRLTGTLWIDPIGGVSKLPIDVEADSSIFGK